MPRMIIAVVAALGLHVLLLMTVLPEHFVVEPEIKGSGHVTVSIVRQHLSDSEEIEEPTEGPEKVETAEEAEQQKEKPLQSKEEEMIPLPAEVIPSPKPVPAEKIIEPKKSITAVAKKKKMASKKEAAKLVEDSITGQTRGTLSANDGAISSEMESLRHPEPLEDINRPPVYPSLARKRGWQGTVLLEVDVMRDGMVENIQIRESSSYNMLDREALEAVRKWRFSPGMKAGKPFPMKVLVPIHFLLQDN